MISQFSSSVIQVEIDCADGWCKGPQGGSNVEYTANMAKESSNTYAPVGICEMGWRNSDGTRASRYNYFQVDESDQRAAIKTRCCDFFRNHRQALPNKKTVVLPGGCKGATLFLEQSSHEASTMTARQRLLMKGNSNGRMAVKAYTSGGAGGC